MTSRELVVSAINFKETNAVPLDIGGHRSSGISAIAYARLKEYLGIKTGNIYVYDVIQQLAIIEPAIMDILKIDTIEMGRAFCTEEKDWKDWVLPDGTACKIPSYVNVRKRGEDWVIVSNDGIELGIQKKGCLYFEQTHYPLQYIDFEHADFADVETAIDHIIWSAVPHPGAHIQLDEDGIRILSTAAEKLRKSTSRAIIGHCGGSIFELSHCLVGMENFFMYLALYPEAVHRLVSKLTEIHCNNLRKWINAVGPHIDIILFGGEDFGSNNGPMISPEMYREFFKPYHAKMWSLAKELCSANVHLHSCGGIEPLLNDFIEAGLEGINPVQFSSNGMDIQMLKDKYANRMVFWGGGCDTKEILHNSTPQEVRAHVRKQIEILRKGGGFVFQQVHNIMANVPPQNILAMVEEVKVN